MAQFTTDMLTAVVPFYNKYVFGWGEDELSLILFLTVLTSIIVFYPWSNIQSRITPRKAAILACIVGIFSYSLFMILIPDWTFVIATLILVGIAIGGLMVAPDVLISYVIDEDEIKTGERREGMYFGIHGFIIRLSTILQGITISAILGYFGYDPRLEIQPASALIGIRILMGIVPTIAVIVGILALLYHPIKGKYFDKLRERLEKKIIY
jgi:GPH family glycoside/pentoside/hexuronide:cation symporter